jgi:hypothetical protein
MKQIKKRSAPPMPERKYVSVSISIPLDFIASNTTLDGVKELIQKKMDEAQVSLTALLIDCMVEGASRRQETIKRSLRRGRK